MNLRHRLAVLLAAVSLAALASSLASAAPLPGAGDADDPACFGAPVAYVAAFDNVDGVMDGKVRYPEQRVFVDNQTWWGEGTLNPTTNIAHAMEMTHGHSGTCFPFGQTWVETSGATIRLDFWIQAHNMQGATFNRQGALNFLDSYMAAGVSLNSWKPTQVDESRFVSATRPVSTLKRCGRVESRMQLDITSPFRGDTQFTSTGYMSKFACKTGRTSAADRSDTFFAGRSWYEGADYCNSNWQDDFRGGAGMANAADLAVPVGSTYKVKVGNGSCSAAKGGVYLNPNIHSNSFGQVISTYSGSGPITTPDFRAKMTPGINRVMNLACEQIGKGVNCNAQVLSALVAS
jgi:hypothetical protein